MWLLTTSGRLGEAETLIRRALYIDQSVLGFDHPDIATDLCRLAWLLMDMRRRNEAEPLFQKSLEIVQKRFGPNYPFVVRELRNLALFFIDTDRLDEAEGVLYQSLGTRETVSSVGWELSVRILVRCWRQSKRGRRDMYVLAYSPDNRLWLALPLSLRLGRFWF